MPVTIYPVFVSTDIARGSWNCWIETYVPWLHTLHNIFKFYAQWLNNDSHSQTPIISSCVYVHPKVRQYTNPMRLFNDASPSKMTCVNTLTHYQRAAFILQSLSLAMVDASSSNLLPPSVVYRANFLTVSSESVLSVKRWLGLGGTSDFKSRFVNIRLQLQVQLNKLYIIHKCTQVYIIHKWINKNWI